MNQGRSIANVLAMVTQHTGRWAPMGDEGPRMIGMCIHCKGPRCLGLTLQCERRVFDDAELAEQLRKDTKQ